MAPATAVAEKTAAPSLPTLEAAAAEAERVAAEARARRRASLSTGIGAEARAAQADVDRAEADAELHREAISARREEIAAEAERQRAAERAARRERARAHREAVLSAWPKLEAALGAVAAIERQMLSDTDALRRECGITGSLGFDSTAIGDTAHYLRALLDFARERKLGLLESPRGRAAMSPSPDVDLADYSQQIVDELKPGFIDERTA